MTLLGVWFLCPSVLNNTQCSWGQKFASRSEEKQTWFMLRRCLSLANATSLILWCHQVGWSSTVSVQSLGLSTGWSRLLTQPWQHLVRNGYLREVVETVRHRSEDKSSVLWLPILTLGCSKVKESDAYRRGWNFVFLKFMTLVEISRVWGGGSLVIPWYPLSRGEGGGKLRTRSGPERIRKRAKPRSLQWVVEAPWVQHVCAPGRGPMGGGILPWKLGICRRGQDHRLPPKYSVNFAKKKPLKKLEM